MLDILKIYEDMDGAEGKSGVRDLLTDILHYCRGEEYTFEEVLESAQEVFNEEIQAQGDKDIF